DSQLWCKSYPQCERIVNLRDITTRNTVGVHGCPLVCRWPRFYGLSRPSVSTSVRVQAEPSVPQSSTKRESYEPERHPLPQREAGEGPDGAAHLRRRRWPAFASPGWRKGHCKVLAIPLTPRREAGRGGAGYVSQYVARCGARGSTAAGQW